MTCTAKSKRSGNPCRRAAMRGRTVCYNHGGKTPRGFGLPQTKTGRWSKDIPMQLAARYQESRNDVRLLGLREDIALLDARIADMLGRVNSGESGETWRQLQQAWAAYQRAHKPEDKVEALAWVGALITAGAQDWAAWADVRKALQERRALVESERKRVIEMQQVLTAEQARALFGAVTQAVKRHVTDRGTLAAIGAELGKLWAARDPVLH